MTNNNGHQPGPARVPPLPEIPPFQPNQQHFQRMPDGETIRIVQYGALDMRPQVIYVSLGVLMHVVFSRGLEMAGQVSQGWATRWAAYKAAAEGTAQDGQNGILRLDGKMLPPGQG